MNLRWIEDYLALCETQSFSQAARRRFLAQSTFSKHIQALEDWLGLGALVDRSSNPIALTEDGEAFRDTALKIAALLNGARRAGVNSSGHVKTIFVSATHSLSATLFPMLSKLLYDRYRENICLHLIANDFSEALARYECGDCDFLLCYNGPTHQVPLSQNEHEKLVIATDYMVPVSIPTRDGDPYFNLAESSRTSLPYLAYTEESHLGRVLRAHDAFVRAAQRLNVRATSAYADSLRAAVIAGLGLAWLPSSLIQNDLQSCRVLLAGCRYDSIPLTIELYRRRHGCSTAVKECWDLFRTPILGQVGKQSTRIPHNDGNQQEQPRT